MATSTVPDDSDKHFTAFLFSKQKGGDVYVYIDVHFVVIQDLEKNREVSLNKCVDVEQFRQYFLLVDF